MIAASTAAWMSAARRDPAPERTLTAVRAIAPVAGTPPNRGAARLARPWPNSSRSGLCLWLTPMPSATAADSSDSSAASAATASAGPASDHSADRSRNDSVGAASLAGNSPIRATSSPATSTIPVAATTARIENGTVGRILAPRGMRAARPPAPEGDARRRPRRDRDRDPVRMIGERRDSAGRDDGDLVAIRCRDTEGGGQLLQADDAGDAEGEPFDHGGGNERHVATGPGDREADQDDPGQQPDRQHPTGAVGMHDRDQYDGHGAGRPRHLQA